MPDTVKKSATHNRLMFAFKAVGPYLREAQSADGCYYFDCLSVCVDDKKSPEMREFWGWWLELNKEASSDVFSANYHIGKYNSEGEWTSAKLPEEAIEEVTRTQVSFHKKLLDMLAKRFELSADLHIDSAEFV
ncbi:sigma factor-binding protein Crl [Vibrio sp. 10N.286.49.B3]|uniref:sigma factor-binding protein Crl n=1 Tax=Vibrio sp. 10N.286.49.B3 TaxID=1880855 RepID=UPI000C822D79|nr:sigma factor-binding protein Crl [Vibrio sp. 10N.286.49.B3]PMH41128.1 sigma factor-binding protein Crl [Vibrio sp. 10N.286.49.B3]